MDHRLLFICLSYTFILFVTASDEEVNVYKAASVLSLNGPWLAYNSNRSKFAKFQKGLVSFLIDSFQIIYF